MEYKVHNNIPLVVLYREKPTAQTAECPFCGASHKYPEQDGHYGANCIPFWVKGNNGALEQPKEYVTAPDGKRIFRRSGVFVVTKQTEQ